MLMPRWLSPRMGPCLRYERNDPCQQVYVHQCRVLPSNEAWFFVTALVKCYILAWMNRSKLIIRVHVATIVAEKKVRCRFLRWNYYTRISSDDHSQYVICDSNGVTHKGLCSFYIVSDKFGIQLVTISRRYLV